MRSFILTAFGIISVFCFGLSASADEATQPPLPSFCTVQSCDHDPEKLQQFIVSFYKWYIEHLDLPKTLDDKKIVEQAITPEFHQRFHKISKAINADPILWYRNTPPSWLTDQSIEMMKLDENSAQFELRLGRPPYDKDRLAVTLKLIDGAWSIDNVIDMNYPIPPSFCTLETCGHDPEKLQQFIISFYKWYIGYSDHVVDRTVTSEDKAILRKSLTPHFYRQFHTIARETADPILWAQDTPTSWPNNITLTVLQLKADAAQFNILLGKSPDDVGHLTIKLKLLSGYWRIDDVYDVNNTPIQGK